MYTTFNEGINEIQYIYTCDKEITILTYGGDRGEGEEERIVEIPFPAGGVVQQLRIQIIARNMKFVDAGMRIRF